MHFGFFRTVQSDSKHCFVQSLSTVKQAVVARKQARESADLKKASSLKAAKQVIKASTTPVSVTAQKQVSTALSIPFVLLLTHVSPSLAPACLQSTLQTAARRCSTCLKL